ncbi:MAG TPA: hemolysin family protein [Ornithinibacter sp.]|nr:hemolysin family protein [Ornithinibacter sp.]
MTTVLSLLAGVLVVLLITAATGYFVAQEFAYMAVDRSRLGARAATGDTGAARALRVTGRTSFMLSGAQLGITVTGLLVGYVAEPLIGESLGEIFGWAGVPLAVGIAVGTVLALALSTLVQMLFGELVPKNLAIARPEPLARWLSRSTLLYLKLFGWLIWVFDQSSNLLLRLLRIEPVHDVEHSASPRDLEHIVAQSRQSGDLPAELSLLLDRILDFPSRDVEHAMIPRSRVGVVRAGDPVHRVRDLMGSQHSRYPVLDDADDIVGVVHLEDVLLAQDRLDAEVRELVRPAVVIPTLMALPDAVRELSASRNQLACVVDEFGGFAGVLTLEDLAEELVGEITDEHDPDHPDLPVVDDDGVWVMGGDVHIDEVERAIDRDLPRGDYETIAGLVIAQLGQLPEVGAAIEVELAPDHGDLVEDEPRVVRILIEVLEVERHVPSLVRLSETGHHDSTEEVSA